MAEGALLDEDSLDGTPLQIAASRGNLKAVKSLLYWDADVGKHNLQSLPMIVLFKSLFVLSWHY